MRFESGNVIVLKAIPVTVEQLIVSSVSPKIVDAGSVRDEVVAWTTNHGVASQRANHEISMVFTAKGVPTLQSIQLVLSTVPDEQVRSLLANTDINVAT